MFALGLCYLNGWSMAAADGARKEQAEWPPHPDRVFMALAAAWFETDEDEEEAEALRWLEALPPPAISASDFCNRTVVTSYVPVNDNASPLSKKQKPLQEGCLPIGRDRKPRSFPVAVPHSPTAYLIWPECELGVCRIPLERLVAKITHVGHSASFVQAWVDEGRGVKANWKPAEGIARLRLRVPSRGSLERLAQPFRTAWAEYYDHIDEIEQAETDLKTMTPPPRVPWHRFPDALLLADEIQTKRHVDYAAAKNGDLVAAANLVHALTNGASILAVRKLVDSIDAEAEVPVLVSVHAHEGGSVNAIPVALAELLSKRLDIEYKEAIVQTNLVCHTGADGYGRLARQARFEGDVEKGRMYLMVDDFIGQGGTLANLRGWIEKNGGMVSGAIALTGKPYSAILTPSKEQLHELRQKHGTDFEKWWRGHFGHSFDCLTQSEARYLARSPDVDAIRDRLAAAERTGDWGRRQGSAGKQKQRLKKLKNWKPATPRRPVPSRWQGYARVDSAVSQSSASPKAPGSLFDAQMVVLRIQGKQVSLPATLKLTTALRGLLMRECPQQPPPEWFSGHRPDGQPTSEPHLALAPLPFVGAEHADGRVMGLALILPKSLDKLEVGSCLEPIFRDLETGLPRSHRLFGGEWIECQVELDTRERPPKNLDSGTWTKASSVWASVTPVVLNRHFDGKDRWLRAADSMKDACRHIGLPRPREVLLHPVSLVEGAPHARDFPRLARKRDGGLLSHSHAVLIFNEPVRGPVLLGAGRFRGYGLCRPAEQP